MGLISQPVLGKTLVTTTGTCVLGFVGFRYIWTPLNQITIFESLNQWALPISSPDKYWQKLHKYISTQDQPLSNSVWLQFQKEYVGDRIHSFQRRIKNRFANAEELKKWCRISYSTPVSVWNRNLLDETFLSCVLPIINALDEENIVFLNPESSKVKKKLTRLAGFEQNKKYQNLQLDPVLHEISKTKFKDQSSGSKLLKWCSLSSNYPFQTEDNKFLLIRTFCTE